MKAVGAVHASHLPHHPCLDMQGARLVAVMLLSFITPLSMLPFSVHLLLQLYAVLMVS